MSRGRVSTVAWLDVTGGVSGDMLLAACLDAGAPMSVLQDAVAALRLPEQVTLRAEQVRRSGLRAVRVHVDTPVSTHDRTLDDVLQLLAAADLDPQVRDRAADVFRALAGAEAEVHGTSVDEVHFHEVGALDSLADVVSAVAGLHALGIDHLVCSPITLGGGRVSTAHGPVPIPGPAVLELLRAHGARGVGGPVEAELATPTGVALAVTLAHAFGPMPPMQPTAIGLGAGGRDHPGHPNVTRLVVGRPDQPPVKYSKNGAGAGHGSMNGFGPSESVVVEANVDDLDPRLWPPTLQALLAAGAADAWLTPILMKKGRPAYTVSVLCDHAEAEVIRDLLFRHTSTIGVRQHTVAKHGLHRAESRVKVAGRDVRVKVASGDGEVLNVSVEYDDVIAVSDATGMPPKVVLELARTQCSYTPRVNPT